MKILNVVIFILAVLIGFSLYPESSIADTWRGGMMQGEWGGGHYLFFGTWVIVKTAIVIIALWFLYRIAKALEDIAKAKGKD